MNIWLIMSGEPLEQFGERPHRVGILSKVLVNGGHKVTWWTTDFDHQHKKYFIGEDKKITNDFDVDMFFLHPDTPYSKNVSYKRIKNHQEVANKFTSYSKYEDKPDVIFCAFPTIELAFVAVNFGLEHNIPVVIDARDMWPDIFLDLFPNLLKPVGKLLLSNYYKKTNFIFENAYSITGMTDKFVEFGLNYAKREKTNRDKSFPFGYTQMDIEEVEEKTILTNLQNRGIDFSKFNIIFFGTIGRQFNFDAILKTAKILTDNDIQFILCGNGNSLEELKNKSNDLDNIIYPGWVTQKQIVVLMKYSKLAIAPYHNKKDFLSSISNKTIEYMAGGLPILSNIDGITGEIINKNKSGLVYNGSSELLENLIMKLKNDEKLRLEMGKNSFEVFTKNFESEKVYSELSNYLENIVEIYKKDKNVKL